MSVKLNVNITIRFYQSIYNLHTSIQIKLILTKKHIDSRDFVQSIKIDNLTLYFNINRLNYV